jgi:hypothetical protein
MALKKKTWIWIIVAVLALGVMSVVAVAGFGYYFFSKHVTRGHATSAEAFKAFDDARVPFKDATALFELDRHDEPRMKRKLEEMPSGARRANTVMILAWDPEKERLAKVSMPFWMIRMGRNKIDLTSGGLDFQRVQLDIEQLERVGPILLLDFRPQTGQRVLVWTQ